MNDLLEALDFYYDHPVEFVQDVIGAEPDEWQSNVLNSLAENPKISVRSGQGVGKTALESWAIVWFLTCRPYARVIATAPTMQQLFDVLWAECAKWLNSSKVKDLLTWTKTKIYMVGDPERWFATAKTATKPENMQGFHEDHMLIVVDEASGVADPIMEAILGTLTGIDNKLLLCGNPNRLEGVFYDSHNQDRDKFKTFKVSSMDSKRTSRDNIEMLMKKYGHDSDVVRVRILGEFPKGALDSMISMETVELATEHKVKEAEVLTSNLLHLGVDVARYGDDSTVITPRIGAKVFPFYKYSKKSTMETAGNVILIAKEFMNQYKNLKAVMIKIDDTGVGGGVTDRVTEVTYEEKLPFTVLGINNGSAATDDYYGNLGSQMWGELRDALEENFSTVMQGKEPIIELPYDDEMIKQLSNRKKKITSKGKIQLESKDDMKARNIGSPDIADSLTLAWHETNTWVY